MLVAQFIARQVINETVKLLPPNHPSISTPPNSLFEHMERVRYLEFNETEGGPEQLRAILKANLPGLGDFVTDE
jgi:hypothetical protein